MDDGTPVRLVAEAHWGMSLVLYEEAYKRWNEAGNDGQQDHPEERKDFLKLMQQSLNYAENACTLYNTINELSRSALMNCQIALILQAMKNLDAARARLQRVLNDWLPTWQGDTQDQSHDIAAKVKRYKPKERANIVSAAACYLASVELDARQCDTALKYVDLALQVAQDSYIVRRADAYMTKGQILAEKDDPAAIVAFRQALAELEHSHREGAKIRAHQLLGAYLMKRGDFQAGEAELNRALQLAKVPSQHQTTPDEGDKTPG
jgi:tetratricopeptide (TPR) repeat protein